VVLPEQEEKETESRRRFKKDLFFLDAERPAIQKGSHCRDFRSVAVACQPFAHGIDHDQPQLKPLLPGFHRHLSFDGEVRICAVNTIDGQGLGDGEDGREKRNQGYQITIRHHPDVFGNRQKTMQKAPPE